LSSLYDTSILAIMAGKFEPKVPVNLDPPKDDVISKEELARANGTVTTPRRSASRDDIISATSLGF